MAGLLAWAADVVGGGGGGGGGGIPADELIPTVLTEEQRKYVEELDQKATNLSRSIQDLRLRIPPPDISQRLPHLHAHSLASNAALALQLNAHSATKEQAQQREVTLQEENAAYDKVISNCEIKIQEKIQAADLLRRNIQEMDEMWKKLREELENAEVAMDGHQSDESVRVSDAKFGGESDVEVEKSAIIEKLESKKKELAAKEAVVQGMEKRWAQIQEKALKQPTPAQREKALDKQLHSLIEQLVAKQAQAEGLVSEIHSKQMELETLNGLCRQLESSNIVESSTARNRFGRTTSGNVSASFDYNGEKLPYANGGRIEHQEKLMLLRSAFVLYILFLHILVFIKISF